MDLVSHTPDQKAKSCSKVSKSFFRAARKPRSSHTARLIALRVADAPVDSAATRALARERRMPATPSSSRGAAGGRASARCHSCSRKTRTNVTRIRCFESHQAAESAPGRGVVSLESVASHFCLLGRQCLISRRSLSGEAARKEKSPCA